MEMNDEHYSTPARYFMRRSVSILVARLIFLEMLMLVLYMVFRFPKFFMLGIISEETLVIWSAAGVGLTVVASLVQMLFVVLITLSWTNEYYIIRLHDIVHHTGILNSTEEVFSLNNIEALTVKQGVIGKLFGFGSIKFFSPVLKQEYYLYDVPKPYAVQQHIEAIISSRREGIKQTQGEMVIPLRYRV